MRAQSERAEATATPRTRRQRKTAAACGAYPFSQTHKPINGQRLGLAEVRLGAQHAHGQAVAARRARQPHGAVEPLVLVRVVVGQVDLGAGRGAGRAERRRRQGVAQGASLRARAAGPRSPRTCSSMLSTKFRFLPSGFSPAANDKIFCTDSASKAPSIFDISKEKKSTARGVGAQRGGLKLAPLSCDVSCYGQRKRSTTKMDSGQALRERAKGFAALSFALRRATARMRRWHARRGGRIF